MGAPVVHWEINARDAGRLQEFYSKLFDWKISADNPMHYGLVRTGSKEGANGGIGQNDPNTPAPSVTFYVQVDDLQKYLDHAVNLGGKVVMPPMEIPGMVTMAMFTDPEGNVIGMVKEEARPAMKKARKKISRTGKRSGKTRHIARRKGRSRAKS
jgi:predicted enzyme related to lactoylglutathione lyase